MEDPDRNSQWEEEEDRDDELSPAQQEAHGWPVDAMSYRYVGCCLIYCVWVPAALCFMLGWYEAAGTIVLLMLSYGAYLLIAKAADWVRGWMWPLQEPSPAKRQLILIRTWCFSIAGVLYMLVLATLPLGSEPLASASPLALLLAFLCGATLLMALLLGVISLAVR